METQTFPFTKAELLTLLDLINGDGHSIVPAERLAERAGVDVSRLTPYESEHKSSLNNDLKNVIFKNGEPVRGMEGIYLLSMLKSLHREAGFVINNDYPSGRGFLARRLTADLMKFAENMSA